MKAKWHVYQRVTTYWKISIGITIISVLSNCTPGRPPAPAPNQYLGVFEQEFGVGPTWFDSDLRVYHAALLLTNGLGLREPGYVVGLENLHPELTNFMVPDKSRGAGKSHVLTHIIRYNITNDNITNTSAWEPENRSCVLYTLLDRIESNPLRKIYDRCAKITDEVFDRCAKITDTEDIQSNSSTSQGVAINLFKRSLAKVLSIGHYSHIIFMVMGWNTDQEWALQNFNNLSANIIDEANRNGSSFRPLVIGVTWPSQWRLGQWSFVPDAVVRGLSFPFKSGDANDIGVHVLRDLIISGVLGARECSGGNAPPLIMIGHSFGARALMKALVTKRAGDASFKSGDHLILLQGAFEFKDLFQKHGQGPIAEAFGAKSQLRTTLTASRYDSAVATAIWGQYTGDIDTYDKVCRSRTGRVWTRSSIPQEKELGDVGCGVIGPPAKYGLDICTPTLDDNIRLERPLDSKPLRYFDASHLINCESPFSGGGAHGDIFRRETAAFLWDEMNR